MPSKKKKYNARFPAARIKKIMQSDEEVGKVAQAVPIIISRTLELFVESLLTKTLKITYSRNAKTLSTSHMKQCIMSEQRFDFLRELVRNIPDISVAEEAANYNEEDNQSSPEEQYADSDTPYDLSMPSTSSIRCSSANTSVRNQHHHSTTNGQNGGGSTGCVINDHHKNYLKRSMSSNPSSVIMHTMSLPSAGSFSSTEHLPAKLSRSESNPVPATPVQQVLRPNDVLPPRLKHQSYSMPSNNIDLTNNSTKPNIHPKALRTPSQQNAAAAIPAPIVSIDYCSKPVVKIDYSNLPLAAATASAAPLSAPAHIASMGGGNNTAFNFNTEPVINIDLSNIVAAGTSSTNTSATPVATISIGSPLGEAQQQSINSKASTMAEPSYNSLSSYNSMATKAPHIGMITPPFVVSPISGSGGGSSALELDEDYDNI